MKNTFVTATLIGFAATLYTGVGFDVATSYAQSISEDIEQCVDKLKPFAVFKRLRNFSHKKGYAPLSKKLVKKLKRKLKSNPCTDAPALKQKQRTDALTQPILTQSKDEANAPETGIPKKEITQLEQPNAIAIFAPTQPTTAINNTTTLQSYRQNGFSDFYTPSYIFGYPVYQYRYLNINTQNRSGGGGVVVDSFAPNIAVPQPSAIWLLLIGFISLIGFKCKKSL
jgi:hypothetical protein